MSHSDTEQETPDYATDLHEHARYGESAELHDILMLQAVSIDIKDSHGSTALHKAAANGELNCVSMLIEFKASYMQNNSGATPLAWAILNKHIEIVKLLLDNYSMVDVLQPQDNIKKKTLLSMGFDAGDEKILSMLLSHPSADKLDTKKVEKNSAESKKNMDNNNNDNEDGNETKVDPFDTTSRAKGHTHIFSFNDNNIVKVRELCPDKDEDEDNSDLLGINSKGNTDWTGLYVWSASVILAKWIYNHSNLFNNKIVLELGSGCGLPGLTVHKHTKAKHVYLSDMHVKTIDNLNYNIELNNDTKTTEDEKKANSLIIDWLKSDTWPNNIKNKCDIIIGSDLVYHEAMVPALLNVLDIMLASNGMFIYVHAEERNSVNEFISKLSRNGKYEHTQYIPSDKDGYFNNPLQDKSDEFVDLCFPELRPESKFVLHTFVSKE